MLRLQFYFKSLTILAILVFLFLISCLVYVSTTYLLENVHFFSSNGSHQFRRNVAITAYDAGPIRKPLFDKNHITSKSSEKNTEKYLRTVDTHKIQRRLLFATKRTRKSKKTNVKSDENDWHGLKSNLSDISEETILKIDFLNTLKLSKNDLKALEKRTKQQYLCKEWHEERKKRLTASTFGRICRMRKDTSRESYVNYLLYGTFIDNAATRHGIKFEPEAKRALEKVLGKRIRQAGLMVDYKLPFLAATPDGLLARNALVEIKCPHNARDMTPEDGITSQTIKYCQMRHGQMHLKISSYYYYQVQGQLHISSKLYCYFCVWTPKGLKYEIIERNDTFWETNMESQLKTFYYENMLPELMNNERLNQWRIQD